MAVGEGTFRLYSRIAPAVKAGDYRFETSQQVVAQDASDPPGEVGEVAALRSHVRVRAPRYRLPPDQVLSTYPPATTIGNYGARLPQVVIKRRTLPWERGLDGQPDTTPWLALVIVTDDEATLLTNEPVASCVTSGVNLDGAADTELGDCLLIRQSQVDKVFPTELDVPLLAHAREVDINDTELMMGDDDGFLAVVIGNRLPVPGRDQAGTEAPITYTACLVNLEGQFRRLLDSAPDPEPMTIRPVMQYAVVTVAQADRHVMGIPPPGSELDVDGLVVPPGGLLAAGQSTVTTTKVRPPGGMPTFAESAGWARRAGAQVSADREIGGRVVDPMIDPPLRFPVLLHWRFTSYGAASFRSLMEGLDSGLIGTTPERSTQQAGRLPLEVVETGHVGLTHRTREGDVTRSWYRGPLTAHPRRADEPRLPLAHSADQLRVVVPDGREDIGLAAAFEVGRLLALSQPSIISSLLQWRRRAFATARRGVIAAQNAAELEVLLGEAVLADRAGVGLARELARRIARSPEAFVGDPMLLTSPGRPTPVEGAVSAVLAGGLGLAADTFEGSAGSVLDRLKTAKITPGALPGLSVGERRDLLRLGLEDQVLRLVSDTITPVLRGETGIGGPTVPAIVGPGIDLDKLFDGGIFDAGVIGGLLRGEPTDGVDRLLEEDS